jgi:taurine dioxygenase
MTATGTRFFTLKEISATGAGEVTGLDCSQPLGPEVVAAVNQAFLQHPILVFRDQHLEPPQQARFTSYFGPLEVQRNSRFVHPDDPYVLILSNELKPDGTPVGIIDAGDFWHSDSSWEVEPVKCTLLHAIKNPLHGGDTAYCNLYLVYDALEPELKAQLEGKRASHALSKFKNPRVTVSEARPDAGQYYTSANELPDIMQPVVRTHPETGRNALFVSPRFTLRIEGMADDESEALLHRLFALMLEERFIYVHKWRDNDFVMWDNRCLNHLACGGYQLPDVRRMHRTTTHGDRPFYKGA